MIVEEPEEPEGVVSDVGEALTVKIGTTTMTWTDRTREPLVPVITAQYHP